MLNEGVQRVDAPPSAIGSSSLIYIRQPTCTGVSSTSSCFRELKKIKFDEFKGLIFHGVSYFVFDGIPRLTFDEKGIHSVQPVT